MRTMTQITPKPHTIFLEAYCFRMPKNSTRREFETNGTHPNYPGVAFKNGNYFVDRSWVNLLAQSNQQIIKDKQWIVKFKDGYGAFTNSRFKSFYDVVE